MEVPILLKKILTTFALILVPLLGVHSPAHAAVQVGVESQLANDRFILDTASVNWWFSEHFGLRGDYFWNTEQFGLAALYALNPKDPVALYLGLSQNDITGKGTPVTSPGQNTALIAGLEWHLSRTGSGLSFALEAGIGINEILHPSGSSPGQAPRLGLAVNYRFPPAKTVASNPDNQEDGVEPDPHTVRLLAKLITLEARNEPFQGQVAVAAVVLNRIRSKQFPDTAPGVIYEPGQFHTARRLAGTVPDQSAIKAAKAALQGSDPSRGALYFYNPATCSEKVRRYIRKHHHVTVRIGNHVFLK